MAMPKKGIRKIVVDGTTYKYMIKGIYGGVSLTIEMPDGTYISRDFENTTITPSIIKQIIEKDK